jgi:hypothetical protein
MKKIGASGTRTVLTRMIWAANTRFSNCVRPGLPLTLIPSSNFGGTIDSTPLAHVSREASKKTTWDDPHTAPALEFADLEETLKRRALMQAVTKRIENCRAVIFTLGLAEVWRDVKADVFVNRTPIPSLLETEPDRYEFHLTGFAQNLANLEAIHALLSQYGHPDVRIVVTVSPVPLMNTFSTMNIVVANTWAKSLLRAVAQEWAAAHSNVDYFPSYEIVQNSDRAAAWELDLRHVKGAGAQHIMELFLRNYIG